MIHIAIVGAGMAGDSAAARALAARADIILLTQPAPQAAALLADSQNASSVKARLLDDFRTGA